MSKDTEHYTPLFSDVERWSLIYIRSQAWKASHTLSESDLMQEARLQFVRILSRGKKRDVVYESREHFIAVFKRALINHFITLFHKDTRYQTLFVLDCDMGGGGEEGMEGWIEYTASTQENDDIEEVILDIDLRNAPDEVRKVINLLVNCPPQVMAAIREQWRGGGAERGNKVLCNMLGYNPSKINLLKQLEQYLMKGDER